MESAMITPNALASFALTVNLICSPLRLSRDLSSIQDAFHAGNDDELFTPLCDEADEFRLPVHADARRRLYVSLRDFGDLVDLVGHHTDQHGLVVDVELDDDDTRVGRVFRDRHAETNA